MDPKYEAEILRAFAVFVEEGLVYEAQKPVFWSTGAQTALAEAEVEYQERDDTAVYVKFPIVGRARPPPSPRLRRASRACWMHEHCHLDDNSLDVAGQSRHRCGCKREICRPGIFAKWDF